jgi:two-component system response regulator FixJ
LAELTEREREVLQGVVDGDSNKAIARRLHISPRTVESYRASLMRKSGATTLADLVRLTLITVADGTADDTTGRRHAHRG